MMDLIRHARRRNRGHARKHAERMQDTPPRHDHAATCKPTVYACGDREWQRERSRTRMNAAPLPAASAGASGATAPPLSDASTPSVAPPPLSAPLAASFPPIGL